MKYRVKRVTQQTDSLFFSSSICLDSLSSLTNNHHYLLHDDDYKQRKLLHYTTWEQLNNRQITGSQDYSSGKEGRRRQTAYQETHECLHGLGERWEKEDSQGLPWHAQLKHLQDSRWVSSDSWCHHDLYWLVSLLYKAHDGRLWPTLRSSSTTKNNRVSRSNTWRSILTTDTVLDQRGLALLTARNSRSPSTRLWWDRRGKRWEACGKFVQLDHQTNTFLITISLSYHQQQV